MKKILLATTMLAGTAGFAAAEVAVTGYAEIGIWSYNYDAFGDYVGNGTGGADVGTAIAFWQHVEATIAMSPTTDGRLLTLSRYTLNEEVDEQGQRRVELKRNNQYLHDKVD